MCGKCLKIWRRGFVRDFWSWIGVVATIYREMWKTYGRGGRSRFWRFPHLWLLAAG
jgi:hypothetical protein